MNDEKLHELISSGNWPLAAGRLVELIAEHARASGSDPRWDMYARGVEAMRSVTVESVRAAYRKIERNEGSASSVIGTLLEGLKRFDVQELVNAEKQSATSEGPVS